MTEYIAHTFGNKIRVRVCGILADSDKILLACHKGLNNGQDLWIPPGGGLEFGETLEDALKREFLEETGLTVDIVKFHSLNEFLHPPLHAIELFFLVESEDPGIPSTGRDPELTRQVISEVNYVTFEKLAVMDDRIKHPVLQNIKGYKDLLNLTSGFKI